MCPTAHRPFGRKRLSDHSKGIADGRAGNLAPCPGAGPFVPVFRGPQLNPRRPSGNLPGWPGGNPHQLGNRRYYRAGTPGRGLYR